MVRKRLYAKQTASVEYEQIDLFSLLEEEQRQVDRTAEQVRGYEITVGHAAVQRLRARGADDETIAAVAAEYREMMMANVLEEHLRDIERRTRERQAQIMDQLMESRHLLNRTDCLKAAPQMTDLDRLNGMNEAQAESMSMAIHEIVESF